MPRIWPSEWIQTRHMTSLPTYWEGIFPKGSTKFPCYGSKLLMEVARRHVMIKQTACSSEWGTSEIKIFRSWWRHIAKREIRPVGTSNSTKNQTSKDKHQKNRSKARSVPFFLFSFCLGGKRRTEGKWHPLFSVWFQQECSGHALKGGASSLLLKSYKIS